jgi:hypothetical protein
MAGLVKANSLGAVIGSPRCYNFGTVTCVVTANLKKLNLYILQQQCRSCCSDVTELKLLLG